jgi:hypothetical protein
MTIQDDSQWVVLHSRFQDPLDLMAKVCPEDPMVREMLAERQRIARKYEEILASVPDGLTPRQRDEYVSARVMGAISSGVADRAKRWSADGPKSEGTNA